MKRLAILLGLGLGLGTAHAAVVRALDVPGLCRAAEVIVHGVAVDTRAAWEGSRIVTRTTVRVDETLKGTPALFVEVKRLGGEVGGVAMAVPGSASLAPGDEVVLFLVRRGDGYLVVGMAQGAFRIAVDAPSGARVAHQDLDGLTLLGPGGETSAPVARPAVRLEDLLRDVRRHVH